MEKKNREQKYCDPDEEFDQNYHKHTHVYKISPTHPKKEKKMLANKKIHTCSQRILHTSRNAAFPKVQNNTKQQNYGRPRLRKKKKKKKKN